MEEKAVLQLVDHAMMINIPHGKFHTCISFEEQSVLFESKAGPFFTLDSGGKSVLGT
jgi:hypothetical protein